MRLTACLPWLLAAAAASGLGGCGAAAARPSPPVHLTVSSPANGARTAADAVAVSGRVVPARARVLVVGRTVAVGQDGTFSTRVALAPGTTIIDVLAGAARARAAVDALRVTRYALVVVPNVTGESPSQARARLSAAGFVVSELQDSNPLRFLVPFPDRVCATSPAPGTRRAPGSTVTLQIDKVC